MSQSNVGQEFSKQLQQRSTPGPLSLRRMAINLWRSLIKRWLPDSEVYPMTSEAIYAEVIDRDHADTLFIGYVGKEANCFYQLDDLIEFFVEMEVPDTSYVWQYLESYAEAGL